MTMASAVSSTHQRPATPGRSPLLATARMIGRTFVPPTIALLVMLGLWQLVAQYGGLKSYILPTPITVIGKMFSDWGTFWSAMQPTIAAIIIGFLLAVAISLPAAVVMVYNDWLYRSLYPLLVAAHLVPKVAIAPLFIIWFGFGQEPKILMVALISFFPLVVDSLVGLSAVRPEQLMLVRSMGASRWQAFWKIRWPGALPHIFSGAKVAITLAVVGAVVAEFVGSDQGLGVVLSEARGNLDSATAFAAIAWLTIIGAILFFAVSLLERALSPGHRKGRTYEGAGSL